MDACSICPWILPALAGIAIVAMARVIWLRRRERITRIETFTCQEWCPLSESEYCPPDKEHCPMRDCPIGKEMRRHEDDTRRSG